MEGKGREGKVSEYEKVIAYFCCWRAMVFWILDIFSGREGVVLERG